MQDPQSDKKKKSGSKKASTTKKGTEKKKVSSEPEIEKTGDGFLTPDEILDISHYDKAEAEVRENEIDEEEIASMHQDMIKEIEASPAHVGRILYPEFLSQDDEAFSISENSDNNREPETESIEIEEDSEYEGEFLTPEEMLTLSLGGKLEEKEESSERLGEEQLAALHEAIIEDVDARGVQPAWFLKPEDFVVEEETMELKTEPETEPEPGAEQKLKPEAEDEPAKKRGRKKKQKDQSIDHLITGTPSVLPDKTKAISPLDMQDDSLSQEELKQLDLKPLLKKKDIDSPVDILSPDEFETEQEFVSQALEKGSLIADQFKVLKVVQEKRFQITYVVKDMNETGKKYFLKEILPPDLEKEELRLRKNKFRDIARLLISAKHPNLAEIYENFHENNREYSLIENVEGLDLKKLSQMAIEPFSEKFVLKIGEQLCDALEFLHYRPQPFTLGNLTPDNIIIDDNGLPNIVDYDFQRFFDPDRTVDFLPDDPTKLYDEITRLSRVFFFLLTKTYYEKRPLDYQWPAAVSVKMQKFLETACADGQKTFGDIKAFRKAFLETQIEEGKEVEYLKKAYNFPFHKIDFRWIFGKIKGLASLSPVVLTTLIGAIIILFFYFGVIQPLSVERYKRPAGPMAFIFTTDEISIYEAGNFEPVFSIPVSSEVSVLYPIKLDIPDKNGKKKKTDTMLVGYKDSGMLEFLSMDNLTSVYSVSMEQTGPTKIIPDQNNERLFILNTSAGNIQVMDIERLEIIDTFLTDVKPVDFVYVNPKDKQPMLVSSHEESGNILFLDAETGAFIDNIELPRKLGKMTVSPGKNHIYILDHEYNCLLVIDTIERVLSRVIPIREGTPQDISLDYEGNVWLTLKNENLLVVFSANLEKKETVNPLGTRPAKAIPDGDGKRFWILNEGTKSITIMDATQKKPRRIIHLGKRPTTISLEQLSDL
jgi:DNA-binding beta-propeller fold protein YncE